MKNATHYADISDTTIWRVRFTPPAGMDEDQISEWLSENWADCDAEGVIDKDIYDDGGSVIISIEKLPTE